MCIRDRGRVESGALEEGGQDVGGEIVGPDAGEGPAQGADGGAAVSYTHLRAHETVLDLVCRLLLEKKKNKRKREKKKK